MDWKSTRVEKTNGKGIEYSEQTLFLDKSNYFEWIKYYNKSNQIISSKAYKVSTFELKSDNLK